MSAARRIRRHRRRRRPQRARRGRVPREGRPQGAGAGALRRARRPARRGPAAGRASRRRRCIPGGQLRPDIVRDLDLARHGLPATAMPRTHPMSSLLPGGEHAAAHARVAGDAATIESIRRLSPRDAGALARVRRVHERGRRASSMRPTARRCRAWNAASSLAERPAARLAAAQAAPARAQGPVPRDPQPVDVGAGIHRRLVRGRAAQGGHRRAGGPRRHAGRVFGGHRLHADPQLAEPRRARARPRPAAPRSPMRWWRRCARSGGELRTSSAVARILVDRQQVHGVRLASGEEIAATQVVSAADPRHTLLGLVGAPELPPEFVWQAQSIRMRGSVAKVHLLTDGGHGLPEGTLVVAPTLKYLERAYDAAKYGEISEQPYLEVTTAGTRWSRSTSSSRRTDCAGRLAERARDARAACDRHAGRALPRACRDSIREVALDHAARPRAALGAHRGRPEPRPADPRPGAVHAPDAGLVGSPHAGGRAVPVRQRRARRRRHQRRERPQCGARRPDKSEA